MHPWTFFGNVIAQVLAASPTKALSEHTQLLFFLLCSWMSIPYTVGSSLTTFLTAGTILILKAISHVSMQTCVIHK